RPRQGRVRYPVGQPLLRRPPRRRTRHPQPAPGLLPAGLPGDDRVLHAVLADRPGTVTSEKAVDAWQRIDAHIGAPPWVDTASFPDTLSNAATFTSIFSATVPANDAAVGATYELDLAGSGSQGSVGNRQTLEWQLRLGGVAGSSLIQGTVNWTDTAPGFRWWCKARVACKTTGVSGTWYTMIFVQTSEVTGNLAPTNNNTGSGINSNASNGITVDTSAANTFEIRTRWGATTGGPSMTSRCGFFRRIA